MEDDTMARLAGKTAIVTGGALGLGAAACAMLAREGASVAVTDLLEVEGKATAEQIRAAGGSAEFWRLDVTNEQEIIRVFGKIVQNFGEINVLVNNAGISGVDKPTHEITLEEWERVMNINVRSVFLCTKHVIPFMRSSAGGSIINLSSIYGIVSAPDIPPYHASKGAIRSMTKTDALLYAKEGIRVNSVHPGFIWTPMVEDLARRSPEGAEAFRANLDKLHPIGHVGEPNDIAAGIVYLASDEAKFVTGSELVIDGGYTAR
jgi:NAD(P)-dependent dehydrogenase (short-subunit alcohol dehydrogenase family)